MTRISQALKIENLVRIPGRNFSNLSDVEAASMIDAHVSGDETEFSQSALSEFMLIPNRSPRLEQIRKRIKAIDESCRVSTNLDGLRTDDGLKALRDLSDNLRLGSFV